jgi:NTP pyrophosphatase (non-canonical NTP hydrolase)
MEIDHYQRWTRATAVYPNDSELEYLALGIAGEAGEVANKVKKIIRGDRSEGSMIINIAGECGDLMWYIARLMDRFGIEMSTVLDHNQSKLMSRQRHGQLKGSGDER